MTATDELGLDNAGRYVGLRQGKYWKRTENSDYYCGGCGWKVTDHDSYCPECGGALHKAALDSSNCTNSERTCGEWRNAHSYYAPTVEDVLLDMHRRLSDVSELYDVDSDELEAEYTRIIEECASKLQLAGDAE